MKMTTNGQPLTGHELDPYAEKLINFVLASNPSSVILSDRTIRRDVNYPLTSDLVRMADEVMKQNFGLRIIPADAQMHEYIVVNPAKDLQDTEESDSDFRYHKMLTPLLTYVWGMGNEVSEHKLRDWCGKYKILEIDPSFWNRVFTDKYLKRATSGDIVWGPRAEYSVSKRNLVPYLRRVLGSSMPDSVLNQFKEDAERQFEKWHKLELTIDPQSP